MLRWLLAISLSFVAAAAHAQCEHWIAGGVNWVAPNGGDSIYAMTTWDPDGIGPKPELLVVAGRFSIVGPSGISNVAAWDGLKWRGFGTGIGGTIRALAVYHGELIAGGDWDSGGNTTTLGRWDGTAWRALGGGVSAAVGGLPQVCALAVFDDKLIVGGLLDHAGGHQTSQNIAQWDGSSWSQLGAGVSGHFGNFGPVHAIAVHGGKLIVGGDFTWVDGHSGSDWTFVAKWNGSAWEPFGLSGNYPGPSALLSDGSDLYVGGYLFAPNGVASAPGVVRWDGTLWHPAGGPSGNPPGVCALIRYESSIVAGGWIQPKMLAKSDGHGGTWTALDEGANDIVRALTTFHGELIVCGDFGAIGSISVPHLARRTLTGIPWIASQTLTRSAPHGGRAVLNALIAFGYTGATYQWRRGVEALSDGGNIAGASTPTLVIRPVGDDDVGAYSCLITHDCGTIESAPASVVVKCAGDLNDDGFVDDSDFVGFVVSYNLLDCENESMPTDCLADLSGDGVVDDADFSLFVVGYDALVCD